MMTVIYKKKKEEDNRTKEKAELKKIKQTVMKRNQKIK